MSAVQNFINNSKKYLSKTVDSIGKTVEELIKEFENRQKLEKSTRNYLNNFKKFFETFTNFQKKFNLKNEELQKIMKEISELQKKIPGTIIPQQPQQASQQPQEQEQQPQQQIQQPKAPQINIRTLLTHLENGKNWGLRYLANLLATYNELSGKIKSIKKEYNGIDADYSIRNEASVKLAQRFLSNASLDFVIDNGLFKGVNVSNYIPPELKQEIKKNLIPAFGRYLYDNLGEFAKKIKYKANSEVNKILENERAMAELAMMLGKDVSIFEEEIPRKTKLKEVFGSDYGRKDLVKFVMENVYRAKVPSNLKEGTGTPLDATLSALGYVMNERHLVYGYEEPSLPKGMGGVWAAFMPVAATA